MGGHGAGTELRIVLVDPELVEQDAELGVVLVVADAVGDEVDLARVSEIHGRRLIGELSVRFGPQLGGGWRFGGFGGEGAANGCVELRIAELAEVVVARRVRNEASAAPELLAEELRRARVVRGPVEEVHLRAGSRVREAG